MQNHERKKPFFSLSVSNVFSEKNIVSDLLLVVFNLLETPPAWGLQVKYISIVIHYTTECQRVQFFYIQTIFKAMAFSGGLLCHFSGSYQENKKWQSFCAPSLETVSHFIFLSFPPFSGEHFHAIHNGVSIHTLHGTYCHHRLVPNTL